ncbi:MAG: hypothetical protein HGA45_15350 [Chloroflexales bacterium]|nr:hypothetical protein [Chloroflexales bacterium]
MRYYTFGLVSLLLVTLVLPIDRPASAASEVVGSGTPASCTAQDLASALAGGGSITFNCGAAPHTIVVTQAFDITAPETVMNGEGLITLRGQGSRIFNHHTLGNIGSSTLTLQNLTLTDGLASGDTADEANGGAIRSVFGAAQPQFKPALVIEHVILKDNNVALTSVPAGRDAYDFGGGAIYSQGGSVIVRDSQFLDNDAANAAGGAIHTLQSDLTIADSTFTNNTAIGATARDSLGGAISIDGLGGEGGLFRVERSTFTNNWAYNSGGAIYVNMYENSSGAQIVDSSFVGNAVIGGARAQGGAIGGGGTSIGGATGNPTITISGSLFTDNSARRTVGAEGNTTEDGSGGALAFPQRARLAITSSSFEGNTAFGSSYNANGGALYVVNNSDQFVIIGSTFANNYAGWVGGAISNSQISGQPGGRVSSSVFANNTAGGIANFQQHCSSELAHDGRSLQYPPRLTNASYYNDVTCFAGKSAPSQTSDPQFRDPRLAPLADNGGPTRTMAITGESPAFNGGDPTGWGCAATDQRGVARPQAGVCDLGAFELIAALSVTSRLIKVGATERTLTILGYGFTNASVAQADGADRPTTYVSSTTLRGDLTAADVAAPGTLTITVRGPGSALEAASVSVVSQLFAAYLPQAQQ